MIHVLMRVYYSGTLLEVKGYKCHNKQTKSVGDCIDVLVDGITSQPKSSKGNMNSDGEES